ncbi:MAG: hypothetical protein ACLFUE_07750 [Desulfobacteraceae bacterium]
MEEKDKNKNTKIPKKNNEKKDDLPYCTSAPSVEHHRADNEDEPCDDGRAGKLNEED